MKKGFLISLAVGVMAITAGVVVTQNFGSQEQPEHLAQTENRSNQTTLEGTLTPDKTATPDGSGNSGETTVPEKSDITDSNKVPEKDNPNADDKKTDAAAEDSSTGNAAGGTTEDKEEPESETKQSQTVEPQTAQVMAGADSITDLAFHEEEGLVWPIPGEILIKYSQEAPVYFSTLGQYKLSPAVVIKASEDTEVLSAAKGIVTDISENEETGVTLTMTLGNGYEAVYGQLAEVKAEVGDTIEKGSVLGKIAKPTKYYIDEGSNLYFQVLEDGTPIDPLLLLE